MEFIRSKRTTTTLDMAPLIDVVFQLLIFFMLSSSFLNPAIKINLPKAVTQDKREAERLLLTIDKEGNYYVNRNPVSAQELKSKLSEKLSTSDKKSIDIKGDGNVSYRYFVSAMDTARQAGATQINIVHEGEDRP